MVGEKKLKTSVDIEKLLQWAYLEELPKREISWAEGIWSRLEQYGSLGGINPDPGGSGNAQCYAQFGLPHKDAEKIELAVGALGSASIEDDYDVIVAELAALVTVNDFRSRKATPPKLRTTVAGYLDKDFIPPPAPRDVLILRSINMTVLVTHHAVMRTRPDWTSADPKPFPTPALHGRGNKIVGECRGKNHYTTGSYSPLRWLPSPIDVVLGRADYHLWPAGLVKLSQTLTLDDHQALPPAASPAPWLLPDPSRRVFSYAVPREPLLPLKPQRPRAGRPAQNGKNSKVRDLLGTPSDKQ
jgi:hypothetical protein